MAVCNIYQQKRIDKEAIMRPPVPEGTILSLSELRIVTFYNKAGQKIGEVDFSTDKILFEGAIDNTADRLFSFLKLIIDPYFKDRKNVK